MKKHRSVSVIVPVYNEEKYLLDVLPVVRKYSQDVLVVDDGSTDRTQELRLEPHRGLGVATVRDVPEVGHDVADRRVVEQVGDVGSDDIAGARENAHWVTPILCTSTCFF